MTDEAKYRVGMVSKMTGLSTHTLRMWEKRYAAVVPHRTDAGGRLYTDGDVERLRLLHRLVREGHAIGGIAKLPDVDLRHMAQLGRDPGVEAQTDLDGGDLVTGTLDVGQRVVELIGGAFQRVRAESFQAVPCSPIGVTGALHRRFGQIGA